MSAKDHPADAGPEDHSGKPIKFEQPDSIQDTGIPGEADNGSTPVSTRGGLETPDTSPKKREAASAAAVATQQETVATVAPPPYGRQSTLPQSSSRKGPTPRQYISRNGGNTLS